MKLESNVAQGPPSAARRRAFIKLTSTFHPFSRRSLSSLARAASVVEAVMASTWSRAALCAGVRDMFIVDCTIECIFDGEEDTGW